MNLLNSFRVVSGGPGKKSGLGLLLSIAKKELQRTEGMLTQVQEIRALQSQLDRHETHAEQVLRLKDSQRGDSTKEKTCPKNKVSPRDASSEFEDLRRQEIEYKKQLHNFLQQYKKRGLPQQP